MLARMSGAEQRLKGMKGAAEVYYISDDEEVISGASNGDVFTPPERSKTKAVR